MSDILSIFSHYELKARMFPALLTILPFGLSILIWYPELISIESSVLIILVLMASLFFLAKMAREQGKKVQSKLLQEWGGFPSTVFLKHSDDTIDDKTKNRYHEYLNKRVKDVQLPTKEEELEDPNAFDQEYNSAIKWLLEKTRDPKKYPLIYQDNANYGFSRNMLGIKLIGIIFTLTSLGITCIGIYQQHQFQLLELSLKAYASIIICIFFLFLWVFFVRKNWVKSTSVAYARSLLASCEETKQN